MRLFVLYISGTPGATPYGGCFQHFNQVEANMKLRLVFSPFLLSPLFSPSLSTSWASDELYSEQQTLAHSWPLSWVGKGSVLPSNLDEMIRSNASHCKGRHKAILSCHGNPILACRSLYARYGGNKHSFYCETRMWWIFSNLMPQCWKKIPLSLELKILSSYPLFSLQTWAVTGSSQVHCLLSPLHHRLPPDGLSCLHAAWTCPQYHWLRLTVPLLPGRGHMVESPSLQVSHTHSCDDEFIVVSAELLLVIFVREEAKSHPSMCQVSISEWID